jgi:tetratricopeptide (TPR) repeat protein
MQHLFTELRRDLARFVEQREALTLVLWAKSPGDTLFAFKILDAMEETSQRDVFLVFAEEYFETARYLDAVMTACDMDIDSGNAALKGGRGDAGAQAWASLPAACFDANARPLVRLRALVNHIRKYYPDPTHRIVLAFLPSRIHDATAYAQLADQLIPRAGYEPWMAGVRFIVSDSQRTPLLVPSLVRESLASALVLALDFSTPSLAKGLIERTADPETPVEDRMAAFVQVAALDHAYKQYDEAIRKYGVAYRHYLATKNSAMQGVCLLFAGYSLEQAHRLAEAGEKYRQALELGISNDIRQLMLNAFMALGALHQQGQDWSGAAQYWEGAAFVAKSVQNPFALADSTLHAGVCQIALGDTQKALALWEAGKQVAQTAGYWDGAATLLTHLIEIERRAGMRDAAAAHERELQVAEHERGYQHADVADAKAAQELPS